LTDEETKQAEVNGAVQSQDREEAKSKAWTVSCLGSWTVPLSAPQAPRPALVEELLLGGSCKWAVWIA